MYKYIGLLTLFLLTTFSCVLNAQSPTELEGKWTGNAYLLKDRIEITYGLDTLSNPTNDTISMDTILYKGDIVRAMEWTFTKNKAITNLYGTKQALQLNKSDDGLISGMHSSDGINIYNMYWFKENEMVLIYREKGAISGLFYVELKKEQ